jgi:prepilin-type N-terminal cleavage/methylation domain-containing protein
MRIQARSSRSGFTLLEVLLASLIALGLLSGLYVAMDVYLKSMDAGRDVVAQSSLSRAIFARVTNDLTSSLGPIQPSTSSSSDLPASGTGTQTTTDPSAMSGTTGDGALNFQIGVKGDSSLVAIFQSRMSRKLVRPPDDAVAGQNPYAADVRRICYFMTANGLACQEILMVTSDQVDQLPVDADEFTRMVASEVKEFSISYFDGTSWTDSWDGTEPGSDGKTPKGPPRSIEVTLGIQVAGSETIKTFKHVIAFPAAPGSATTQSETTPQTGTP